MARKTKPGDSEKRGVTNLTEAKEVVRNAVPSILNLKDQRKAINDEIKSIRERVNAVGIPKKALDHAIKMREMDPDDRERFDEGLAIARDAISLPMSRSLFDFLDTPAGEKDEEPAPEKPNGRGAKSGAEALKAGRAHLSAVPDAMA